MTAPSAQPESNASPVDPERPLIAGFRLGPAGAQRLTWEDLEGRGAADLKPEDGFVWLHFQRISADQQPWLRETSGLDPLVVDSLLAEETRPRSLPLREGVLLNLRGVNLNPGQDPEDMISLRLWIESGLVVSVRLRRLLAVQDTIAEIDHGRVPKEPMELVAKLALRMTERMESTIHDLSETIDALEDDVLTSNFVAERAELAKLRRQAITLRRYIAPQKDALTALLLQQSDAVSPRTQNFLREAVDRVTRFVEDLEAVRDRASIVAEHLADRRAEAMNRHSFVLTIVAAIFLPLGLITGLLGINVGGIPGAQWSYAFLLVTVILILLGLGLLGLFAKLGWLRVSRSRISEKDPPS